ncbi:MAG TPA: DUF808 domain-containing protein [Nitriliruptoraceae bacterium]|nr:DUF808 domain-containing protein [Nitriliruptoraceae bacterium]
MAGGLVALLDDVAALAKLAASSVDDVAAAAGRASSKAAGVMIDDTAVTPQYMRGLAAERELPIIRKIALGSLRNKLVFILPVALLLSQFVPVLVEIILMLGGTYLCFEGAEKVMEKLLGDPGENATPAVVAGSDHEKKVTSGAIRTDLILSTEIMVIALKEVIDESFVSRAVIMAVVAVLVTVLIYGVVAAIVKMDDIGLHLAQESTGRVKRFGELLVAAMPKVLALLTTVGTAAMLWVGGHILLVGTDELGWHAPYDWVHGVEEQIADATGAIGDTLAWLFNTGVSAIIGLVVGVVVATIAHRFGFGHGGGHADGDHAAGDDDAVTAH